MSILTASQGPFPEKEMLDIARTPSDAALGANGLPCFLGDERARQPLRRAFPPTRGRAEPGQPLQAVGLEASAAGDASTRGERKMTKHRPARAHLAALFAALIMLAACSSLSMTVKRYPDIPPQPQTNADQVEILRKEPTRPHFAVGSISVSSAPDNPDLPVRLREAAAQLGANAVVFIYDGDRPSDLTDLIAVAIRYR
jgi:hypothetical protein